MISYENRDFVSFKLLYFNFKSFDWVGVDF